MLHIDCTPGIPLKSLKMASMLRANMCIGLAGRQWTMVAHAIKSLTDAENEVFSSAVGSFLAM